MSEVHYFQRYSSPENAVTNNTLQLLARIYGHSPKQASALLTELTGQEIEIGIEVRQQTRTGDAVPDGRILQRSFKIIIESKVGAGVDVNQLSRHVATFEAESQRILILLTKEEVGQKREKEISEEIARNCPGVVFKAVTYEAVCNAVGALFKDYECEMQALTQDYVAYCEEMRLFDQSKYLMRISPCSESFDLNRKYGIYFHPSDRGYTKHSFAGMYTQKSVRCLWAIDSVFDAELRGSSLIKQTVQGRDTTEFDEKIISIIGDAARDCGYDISTGHRFFCGRKVYSTNYEKTSLYGIQGSRFVNLKNEIGEYADAEEVAQKLSKRKWS